MIENYKKLFTLGFGEGAGECVSDTDNRDLSLLGIDEFEKQKNIYFLKAPDIIKDIKTSVSEHNRGLITEGKSSKEFVILNNSEFSVSYDGYIGLGDDEGNYWPLILPEFKSIETPDLDLLVSELNIELCKQKMEDLKKELAIFNPDSEKLSLKNSNRLDAYDTNPAKEVVIGTTNTVMKNITGVGPRGLLDGLSGKNKD